MSTLTQHGGFKSIALLVAVVFGLHMVLAPSGFSNFPEGVQSPEDAVMAAPPLVPAPIGESSAVEALENLAAHEMDDTPQLEVEAKTRSGEMPSLSDMDNPLAPADNEINLNSVAAHEMDDTPQPEVEAKTRRGEMSSLSDMDNPLAPADSEINLNSASVYRGSLGFPLDLDEEFKEYVEGDNDTLSVDAVAYYADPATTVSAQLGPGGLVMRLYRQLIRAKIDKTIEVFINEQPTPQPITDEIIKAFYYVAFADGSKQYIGNRDLYRKSSSPFYCQSEEGRRMGGVKEARFFYTYSTAVEVDWDFEFDFLTYFVDPATKVTSKEKAWATIDSNGYLSTSSVVGEVGGVKFELRDGFLVRASGNLSVRHRWFDNDPWTVDYVLNEYQIWIPVGSTGPLF